MATSALETVLRRPGPQRIEEPETCPGATRLPDSRNPGRAGRGPQSRSGLRAIGQLREATARCIERGPFLAVGVSCLAGVVAGAALRLSGNRKKLRAAFRGA
jgi:hypothetical protein